MRAGTTDTPCSSDSTHAGRGIPLIGDKFPTIEAQTTHGKMKLPDDFSGKWFVPFSHPLICPRMLDRVRGIREALSSVLEARR